MKIAETRVRYGYRRIHVLLRREGWQVNPKQIYRLYKEMGLQLRKLDRSSGANRKEKGPPKRRAECCCRWSQS